MDLKISRILHAGYIFECDKDLIAFDPIFENPFSKNCYAFPPISFETSEIKKLRLSAVFISHYHDDHWSLESLNLLDRNTPIFGFCIYPDFFDLLRELGFRSVTSLNLNEEIRIGRFGITPRRALDADVDSVFEISVLDINILNVVDSWIDPQTFDQYMRGKSWDLVLWPFQTMRELEVISPLRNQQLEPEIPHEWIEQLKGLKARFLVPSACQFKQEDWSWYNDAFFPISYKFFTSEIRNQGIESEVIRLDPGESICFKDRKLFQSDRLPWIRKVKSEESDYSFEPLKPPPKTSEISQRFEALSVVDEERVLEFCEKDLTEAFNKLEPSLDPYFAKTRFWELRLFNHRGEQRTYLYRIENRQISRVAARTSLDWITEVPIARLFGALANGETLTSMYLRINDHPLAPAVESEISDVDLGEDPLIRALFTGKFAAYQKAQIRRILNNF